MGVLCEDTGEPLRRSIGLPLKSGAPPWPFTCKLTNKVICISLLWLSWMVIFQALVGLDVMTSLFWVTDP